MARDLGKRLLGEVEVVRLDEILDNLHNRNGSDVDYFGFSPFDRLVHATQEPGSAMLHRPIIEISSITPDAGKTHILYHLCAIAILPRNFVGQQGCTVIVDLNGTFSVPRLATQIRLLLKQQEETIEEVVISDQIRTALKHVHLYRPQSLASTIATLDSIPTYLFTSTRHHSSDRKLAFIAIESVSAFYWEDRAASEDAAFAAATSSSSASIPPTPPSQYQALTTSIRNFCATLHCPAVVTTTHIGYPPSLDNQGRLPRSLRPSLPMPWSSLSALRFVVRRLPVRKFPAGINVEDALREAEDRLKAVEEGKFECFVNEWGVDERALMRMRTEGMGFEFRIGPDGVGMPLSL